MVFADGMWNRSNRRGVDEFLITSVSRWALVQSADPPETVFSRNDQVGNIGGELRLAVVKGDEKCAIAWRMHPLVIIPSVKMQPYQDSRLRRCLRYPERQNDECAQDGSHAVEYYCEA